MAIIRFNNVGIRAVSACVPKTVESNRDLGYLIPEDEIEKTIRNIGIEERRIADADCCSSDLCYTAAVRLVQDNGIDPQSVAAQGADVVQFFGDAVQIANAVPVGIPERLGIDLVEYRVLQLLARHSSPPSSVVLRARAARVGQGLKPL